LSTGISNAKKVKSNILKLEKSSVSGKFLFDSISYVGSSSLDLTVTMGPIYKELCDKT